jgi:predicted O-methyltransferase YrrM
MKRLAAGLSGRLRFACAHPAYTVTSLVRELLGTDERVLAKLTDVAAEEIRGYLREPFETPDFSRHLRQRQAALRAAPILSAEPYAKKVLLQYAAARALRPAVVVETGVANGVSSAYLLLALRRNGRGVLHSIEIGDRSFLAGSSGPGWLVPDWLRVNWRLHLGDARQILPDLLPELGPVDIFIHDSLHTPEQMRFEFECGFRHLRPGGLLVADDALWNSAFSHFARLAGTPAGVLHGVGFLRK